MAITLDTIQSQISALVDQNEVTTSISATDYSLRLAYINMAIKEWGETYDWDVLYKRYITQTSTASANASIALPSDYRKLASFPIIVWTGTQGDQFPEVKPQEDGQFSSTDRRIWLSGNNQAGFNMYVLGVALQSGASIMVPYYATAKSLASPTDVPEIPNPEYLVQRTVAYLWQGREDPRFPAAQAEANRILSNLIEYENTFGRAAYNDSVRTVEQSRASFRFGRD